MRSLFYHLSPHYRPNFSSFFDAYQKNEIKINTGDHEGNTLLHLAVIENLREKVEFLLNQNASKEKKNSWGMTPRDLSHYLHRKECLDYFEKRPTPPILIYRNKESRVCSISIQEFEEKLQIKYLDQLEFENIDFLRWIYYKCQKQLKKDNFRQMNQWILALYENGIYEAKRDKVYIRWIDPSLGYGVFASEHIPALTYIGEYTGVVKLRKKRKAYLNDYIFSYVAGPKTSPFIIDAKEKGNFTRFINHSLEPNLTSRWVITNGITRIIVFSNQFRLYWYWYWPCNRSPTFGPSKRSYVWQEISD